jgi:hypothetical protein
VRPHDRDDVDGFVPDRRLAAALRELTGDAPVGEVDWTALHGRIVASAAAPLSARRARRARRPWWQFEAGWARTAVPLGVAASLAAVLLVGRASAVGNGSATPPLVAAIPPGESSAASTLVSAIGDAGAERELVEAVSGPTTADALLEAVLSQ